MKKGLILLSVATVLFLVYVPASLSWLLSEHFSKMRRFSQNHLYGLHLYGADRKTEIRLEEFTDYDSDNDYINKLTTWLWHSNDTVFVEMKGYDAYPMLRKTSAREALDTVNEIVSNDRMKISVDEGCTRKKHLNYFFSFGGVAQVAGNVHGSYEQGTRRNCDVPWSLKADGANWTLSAAIPLHGQKSFGLNMERKYYGGRNVRLVPSNDPAEFYLVNLM